MTSENIKEHVISFYGNMDVLNNNWANLFNSYIDRHKNELEKTYDAISAIYNPLDNNDVTTETVTLNKTDETQTTTGTSKIKQYDKSFDVGLENTAYTETEMITPSKITPSNTLNETFQNTDNNGYNNTSKTLERKHGNISAVTNQSIIEQEIKLRMIDWLEIWLKKAVYYGGVYYAN